MNHTVQESLLESEPVVESNSKRKWLGRGVVSLCILLVVSVAYFISTNTSGNNNPSVISVAEKDAITPTPMPFQELTIPYLREREYTSTLGNREFAYDHPNYTAYLTSYESDGLTINGLLTIPAGEVPAQGFPAIVFVHGYIPPAQYQTLEKYSDYVDYLARNGFVVFKIDLRGHGESEGEAGGGYYASDYVIDTLNARAALQVSNMVNPRAVGIWGHSMAGNIALRSIAARPEIPAIVVWAGAVYTYSDMQEFGIQDSSYQRPPDNTPRQRRRNVLFDTHGSYNSKSEFWRQVVPTNFLSDVKGAIQLHHAVNDDVVNIGYSRNLNSVLDTTSITHELHEYPTGGHNIDGESFVRAMQRTVEFYRVNLDGK